MKPGSVKFADHIGTDDGHQWNVVPGLLCLVHSAGDVQWP